MIDMYAFKRFLNSEGIPYNELETFITIKNCCKKYKFNYMFLIGITENICKIHIETEIQLTTLTEHMLKTLNSLNENYLYYKFFIRLPDMSNEYIIAMGYDFDINQSTTFGDIFQVLATGSNILEDAYPEIQRQIWR